MTLKINKIKKVRTAYFTSTLSITLVLFMAGLTLLVLFNAHRFSDFAKNSIGFTVFLKNDAKPADNQRLYKVLQISNFTKSAEYVSKKQAAKKLQAELGEDFQTFLGYNPLPNSIEVKLIASYASEDSIKVIQSEIEKNTFVKEFFYQKSLIEQVSKNIKFFGMFGTFFSIILLLISVTLISNTVRLSIHSKRFLIKTAQLVGATKKFIRKPFVVNSIVSGIFSTAIASVALVATIIFIQKNIGNIISTQGIWLIMLILLIFGVSITGFSGYNAVNNYLSTNFDNLHDN